MLSYIKAGRIGFGWGAISLRRRFVATVQCCGRPVRYYLLADGSGNERWMYGILVEGVGDREVIHGITASRLRIQTLLERLVRGRVTPVSVRDVVEDWLLT